MSETVFCANCETEAVCRVVHGPGDLQDVFGEPRGFATPLCATCKEAYRWGQASPDASFKDLDEEDHDSGTKQEFEIEDSQDSAEEEADQEV